ncbi:MAG: pyrroline-5-carboxylate reductase [Clostridiales bacterium]|nr:pyrroline-5-carboxylate reductase [Clostridiales bacterium]
MKKIGFIGAGNMATAIINGLIAQNDGKADFINAFDVSSEKCDAMQKLGVSICKTGVDVVAYSDIIVLAVKPQNYPEVLQSLKNNVTEQKTFVSIAAGISIAFVQSGLGCNCPVVRVMPNTPLLLKKGASALCPSENISDEDKQIVYNMFAGSGVCEYITEEHMNEIIAVNGSSPAYIYLFAKAMADYAQSCGIDYGKAMNLICATLEGSAAMLRESGDSADELIAKVSSKGGTTIAALDRLKAHGFYEAVQDAMTACTDRAEELGK